MNEQPIEIPKQLRKIVAEQTSNGIDVAVGLFIQKNRIDAKPSELAKNPVGEFITQLTLDWTQDKSKYPFYTASIKQEIDGVINEYAEAIMLLFNDKDFKELKKLICIITCGQTLEFLEFRKARVKDIIRDIKFGPTWNHGMAMYD